MDGGCIIFPHIPKCAGSSLKQQLEEAGVSAFFDYDAPPSLTQPFQIMQCEQRNQDFNRLDFSDFDLVFGHFPLARYRSAKYRYVCLLRDPLERALSHFFFWKNKLPESNAVAISRNPIILDIKKGKVDFIEFIERQRIGEFYHCYLGDARPADFTFVGFMDRYDGFVTELSRLLGVSISSNVRVREGIKEEVASDALRRATRLLQPDYELYGEYRSYWCGG